MQAGFALSGLDENLGQASISVPARRRQAARPLVIILLLAALGLRLHGLTMQDIWWDEARNIDVALRPFLEVATAPELDIHPPVYFWTLHVWGRLSGAGRDLSPLQLSYLMRFVSVCAGVAGVALAAALTRDLGGRFPAVLAAFVGAFSPFWLAESQEARMYTLGFALLMGAGLALFKTIGRCEPTRDARAEHAPRWIYLAAFSVLAALALITHYNAVFVVVAWYAWWGVLILTRKGGERLRELGAAAATGITVTLLVLPVAPIAMRQIPGYANPNLVVPSVADYLWQNWQAYVGGYAFTPESLGGFGTVWLWVVFAMFMIGASIAVACGVSHTIRGDSGSFPVCSLLVGRRAGPILPCSRRPWRVQCPLQQFRDARSLCVVGNCDFGWR